jgi:hypothetical protein
MRLQPSTVIPVHVASMLALLASSTHASELNVTNDASYRYGEHQTAINPRNPKNIVYATVGVGFTKECQEHSTDCQLVTATFGQGMKIPQARGIFENPKFTVVAAYSTLDGGKTWKRAIVPVSPAGHPNICCSGDPSVAVTRDGTFYISFDANDWGTPEHPLPDSGVGVSKSTDGGLTWGVPVLAGTAIDGPKLTSDPNTGMVYEASGGRDVVSSMDGVHWTKPEHEGSMGMSMSAANGEFATTFKTSGQAGIFGGRPNNDLCGTNPAPCVVFETSRDSGVTWSRHVAPVQNLSGSPFDQPMVAADPSKAGHFAIAVPADGKEFHVYQTRDSGNRWSNPVTITEDPTKHHYHAAMAYSRKGVLGLMWRSMQPAPGQTVSGVPAGGPGGGPGVPYNVWAVVSRDGGNSFSTPLKVSTKDSFAPESTMFGNAGDDYSSLSIEGDNVYVGWAQWMTGDERQGFLSLLRLSDFKAK